jgi:hypothetical protein
VPIYVVERYVPGLSVETTQAWQARLRQTTEELGREGTGIRYLGSTVVLVDESCFCRFEAPSLETVTEANRRAGVPFARIVPALEVGTERASEGGSTDKASGSAPAEQDERRIQCDSGH